MGVAGLDHVNVLTDDLEASAAFYEAVLGLVRSPNPTIAPHVAGYWMRTDAAEGNGAPILHLVDRTTTRGRYDDYRPGSPTNALHHIALRCTDFAETLARIAALGVEHRVREHSALGLRQIFLTDPDAVNWELNFLED